MLKKICMLTSVHNGFDVRIFHKEARTLAKIGCDVVLIAQHTKEEVIDGIRIVPLPKPKNRLERMTRVICKLFRLALKERADVYHFHDPELIPVGLVLKLFGKKVIYDVHEDVPKQILSKDWIGRDSIRKTVSILFRFLEQFSSKKFDATVAATPHIAKKFSREAITINNFPVLDFSMRRNNYNSANNSFNLVYAGGIAESNGIFNMIKALELLDNNRVKMFLIGNFSPSSLEEEVVKLRGFKKVEYVGWIPLKEVYIYYLKSHVGIICDLPEPNAINSLPNKLFEYMLFGLPVITSNFHVRKQLFEKDKCGICVDPTNPKEIAGSIGYLYKNPEVREQMGKNGHKAVLDKYNWESEVKKLVEVYSKLLGANDV